MTIKAFVVATALALAAVGVQASPMFQYNGSDIVGVTGVDVNGVTYNASFLDAAFGYLYINDPTILYSDSFAVAASSALYDFISTVDPSTYQASDFRGCSGWDICYLFTAYLIENNLAWARAVFIQDNNPPSFDAATQYGFPPSQYSGYTPYTRWTQSETTTAPVPEPSVALLVASGLIVFGVARRKRKGKGNLLLFYYS